MNCENKMEGRYETIGGSLERLAARPVLGD